MSVSVKFWEVLSVVLQYVWFSLLEVVIDVFSEVVKYVVVVNDVLLEWCQVLFVEMVEVYGVILNWLEVSIGVVFSGVSVVICSCN